MMMKVTKTMLMMMIIKPTAAAATSLKTYVIHVLYGLHALKLHILQSFCAFPFSLFVNSQHV